MSVVAEDGDNKLEEILIKKRNDYITSHLMANSVV